MEDNVIKVSVRPNKQNSVKVSSNVVSTPITANSDTSQVWSQVSKNWAVSENIVDNTDYSSKYYANKAKESASNAQGYESATRDVYNGFLGETTEAIENVQGARDEAIANIETSRVEAVDSINSTKTTILSDIEFVADGEKKEIEELIDAGKEEIQELTNEIKDNAEDIINRVGISMFDTILKDHVLTYEESKGLALQGTWVYKTAISGSRYGYADFYNKCLEEQGEATKTTITVGSRSFTGYVHPNGHIYYGYSSSSTSAYDTVNLIFEELGSAWFYGIDKENERIFLPRNNWFEQVTSDASEVGRGVEAGLPNIEAQFYSMSAICSGAVEVISGTGSYGGSGTNYNNKSFDASRCSTIYGNSDTVQPNAVKKLLYICVGNQIQDNSWVNVVEQVKNGAKDIEDEKLKALNELNNKENAGLSALANASNTLRETQITNCLLEVPQRIKYTLENGTLTIKAGSVVIVPYGTEDLTAQYPVGATFLHENFKVYDTQFANGKFFVWAELVSDVSYGWTTTDSNKRILAVDLNDLNLVSLVNSGSATQDYSGTANYLLYRTDTNIVKEYASGTHTGTTISLPIGFAQADGVNAIGSVSQVFNGMGYIGSTVWVDKGVKGLIPNGRNEDGTLNNIEYIENNLKVFSATSTVTANYVVAIRTDKTSLQLQQTKNYYYVEGENDLPNVGTSSSKAFVLNENSWYYWHSDTNYTWQKCEQLVLGDSIWENGVVTSFNTKLPFRAVDHNELQEVHCVVETYVNGTSWCRIWSDGWCEQGGIQSSINQDATTTITLLKSYRNNLYNVVTQSLATGSNNNNNNNGTEIYTKQTSSFIIYTYNYKKPVYWEAKGYLA